MKSQTILLLVAVACLTASAFSANDSGPCSTNTEMRQLDYWLGNWTITNPGTSGSGTSNVHLLLDKCLLVESWDNGKGHVGENLFAYSPDDKTWHGMFADNQGHTHIFVNGKVSAGAAEFDGSSHGPNGEIVLNRIKVVRLAPNKVEQTWEKSNNNGVSWRTVFRGEYRRANP